MYTFVAKTSCNCGSHNFWAAAPSLQTPCSAGVPPASPKYQTALHPVWIENTEETDDGLKRNGYKIIEHTKSAAGQRQIPLTQTARDYFERIKKLNQQNGLPTSEDDIIFQRDGMICNQRVFDCRIHKYCNPDTVRRIAGHEDIEMTMKYCRGCEERHELEAILEQAFSN